MRKVTMNEYIELIDELCAKCDSGELTEEGVNRMMYQMIIYHQVTILNILPFV